MLLPLFMLLLAPMLLQVFPICCWPYCYWPLCSFLVHALAGAVANVSVVGLIVTGLHDAAAIHAIAGACFFCCRCFFCCWPCCYWHPCSFPVHALAGAVASVSAVVGTTVAVIVAS